MKPNRWAIHTHKSFFFHVCRFIAFIMMLSLILSACDLENGERTPSETIISSSQATMALQSDPIQDSIAQRCEQILAFYYDVYTSAEKVAEGNAPVLSGADIAEIEDLLIVAGFDVIVRNGVYPPYLITGDRFHLFWDQVQNSENAEQEVIEISDTGGLSYTLFRNEDGKCSVYFASYGFDSAGRPQALSYEKHTVQDMELTERGNFYYRIFPAGDKHYADYSLIRLTPPDKALYDLTAKYIMPIGYQAANIFLVDWNERDFGDLSFNDLFEYLYSARNGTSINYTEYPINDGTFFKGVTVGYYEIPSELFESTILPYFSVTIESFRKAAFYDEYRAYYPWKPFLTNDAVWYPYIEPSVVGCTENDDGTITLYVDVLSTDLKTDRLFSHKVTIRLLEDGNFQYVGNQITFQMEPGLPPGEVRLSYNRNG